MAQKPPILTDAIELLALAIVDARSTDQANGLILDLLSHGELDDIKKRLAVAIAIEVSRGSNGTPLPNTKISQQLQVSPNTVGKTHRQIFGPDASGVLAKTVRKFCARRSNPSSKV